MLDQLNFLFSVFLLLLFVVLKFQLVVFLLLLLFVLLYELFSQLLQLMGEVLVVLLVVVYFCILWDVNILDFFNNIVLLHKLHVPVFGSLVSLLSIYLTDSSGITIGSSGGSG